MKSRSRSPRQGTAAPSLPAFYRRIGRLVHSRGTLNIGSNKAKRGLRELAKKLRAAQVAARAA